MKQRKWILWVVLVASMMVSVPARAQDAAWTAWLYDAVSGRMTEVDNSGALISQFQLPAEPGSTYSLNVAISADGDLVGYSANATDATYVNVYSLSGQTTVYSTALPAGMGTSLDYSASAFNFSDVNSTFAFSFAAFGDSTSGWQIRVVDLATLGETTLNEGDAAASTIVSPGFGFTLPLVMYNRNQEVKFLMLPLGTDGMPSYDAYTWNTASGAIAPDATYITPDVETFAQTGEAISTIADSRFPDSADPTSGYPSNNTLVVFDPNTKERFVAAVLPRVYNATFIQGGERVAAVHYEILPDNIYDPSIQIIERGGQVSGTIDEADKDEVTSLFGTANGFVYTVPSGSDSGGTDLYYVDTRAGTFTPVEVWESAPGSGGILMWVGDASPVAAASFEAWGRVAEAAQAEPTTPPIAPPASSVLTVGGEATVQTTEGEVLNLRSGAGRDFGLLGTVRNGTVVTLLEGPTDAGGFLWWRVRLPSGTEGWVVESADGIETLIPR